jgi:hypothetical protein
MGLLYNEIGVIGGKMGSFNGFILTNDGKKLLEEALTGKRLVFTKFQFGDGEITEDPKEVTELVSIRKEVPINQIVNSENGQVMLKVIVDNRDVEEGYYIKEIGVLAKCDDGEEILYAYNKARNADYLPIHNGKNLVELEYQNYITIAQIEDVTAIIDGNITYLTKEEANEKFVPQTQIATLAKEGIINELRIKELSQETMNENKAKYDFEERKILSGLINTNSWDTNIAAHLNFHRPDLKDETWWKNLSENQKAQGWDMRLFPANDGTYLGIHKIRNDQVIGLLDTNLIWAGSPLNYLNNNGGSKLVTCDQTAAYVSNNIYFYDTRNIEKHLGILHYSTNGAPYHQGPRTNWIFSRLLDEIDRADFDNRFNDLFNRHNNQTVWDLRLAGYINPIIFTRNDAMERNGYVVTGIINFNSDNYIDSIQLRALQMFRGGIWYNVPFV